MTIASRVPHDAISIVKRAFAATGNEWIWVGDGGIYEMAALHPSLPFLERYSLLWYPYDPQQGYHDATLVRNLDLADVGEIIWALSQSDHETLATYDVRLPGTLPSSFLFRTFPSCVFSWLLTSESLFTAGWFWLRASSTRSLHTLPDGPILLSLTSLITGGYRHRKIDDPTEEIWNSIIRDPYLYATTVALSESR